MEKYQIKINQVPEDSIATMRVLRSIAKIDLRDAKQLFEYIKSFVPCVLVVGINKETADQIMKIFEENEIKAIVENSTIEHSMILYKPITREVGIPSLTKAPWPHLVLVLAILVSLLNIFGQSVESSIAKFILLVMTVGLSCAITIGFLKNYFKKQ